MNTPQINNGGPAFPCEEQIRCSCIACSGEVIDTQKFTGMTLRDWFAGQAMTAIIGSLYCTPETTFNEVSGRAYAQADAMIKAREVES
jgi:hypothetical protein